ncbi:MAG: LysM peptidoglycan-binding domain-containing protein, partial [Gammaproteobacteria bacterium]|nr:LysM peptidoglycan-binding domain-containing protein [Gammaproteobacteria bacterium]
MFQFKLIILCVLLLLNTGCIRFVKPQTESDQQSASADKIVTHHRVMPGETLYSIAFEYGRDHRDVARWNNIRRPYTIFPKQRLRVIPIADDEKKIRKKRKSVT